MADKDISEKNLEAYDDVFADIVNGFLFQGRQVVSEDDLTDAQPFSMYKAEGKVHQQERDVAKYWQRTPVRIALLGLENQTDVDPDMPLRVIGYDGAAYRAELAGEGRYPVVTLVLYFGERHWQKRRLYDCVNVPDALKPYVNDYRINVFEVAFLTDDELEHFHSDFRIVADYFAHRRLDRDYRPTNPQAFRHQTELLSLLTAISRDSRFVETIDPKGGAPTNMCEVLDRVEARGFQQGIIQGITQGISQGISQGVMQQARRDALNMRDIAGIDNPTVVARVVGVDPVQVTQWFADNPRQH